MKWDSNGVIGRVRERYKELFHKGWEYRSFYNGWLEGRVDVFKDVKEDEKKLESAIQLIKDIRHGNIYNDVSSVCEKFLKDNGYES